MSHPLKACLTLASAFSSVHRGIRVSMSLPPNQEAKALCLKKHLLIRHGSYKGEGSGTEVGWCQA